MLRSSISILALLISSLTSHETQAAEAATEVSVDTLEFYLYQAFNTELQEQRYKLNHVGIEGIPTPAGFLVSGVLQGFPAHVAGINRGDIIVSAQGSPFHPIFSFNDSSRAPDGFREQLRSFDLEIQRDEKSLSISISPVFQNLYSSYRTANRTSVQEFSSGNKVIGYVQLWALSRNSDSLLNLQQLVSDLAHCDGIIVDLRGSYGFLDREHFKLFSLNEPDLAMTGVPGWLENWNSPRYPLDIEAYRKPIVLLVDESTRAGAELIALALDDAERITSLGSSTAGMLGEIQFQESGMTYLPASEHVVNGQQLEGVGIEPEQMVDFPFSEVRRDDPQFETAVTWLLGVI